MIFYYTDITKRSDNLRKSQVIHKTNVDNVVKMIIIGLFLLLWSVGVSKVNLRSPKSILEVIN